MAKTSVQFLCSECGWSGPKWYGRCPECGQWGTIEEFHEARPSAASRTAAPGRTSRTQSGAVPSSAARPITEIGTENMSRIPTGFSEFDRVLGSGIVPGSVTLIAGEPGIGKSTLLLETAGNVAREVANHRDRNVVLYVSGEESQAQVRMRASRINAIEPNMLLAATTDLATVLGLIEQVRPALAIVDSAQTIVSQDVDGISGGSTQVREVASALIDTAKTLDVPVLLVGHVTKDGSIAGPRTLEHLVDVVCQFEGDAQTALRMLRAVKNRFGPTDEVGCFDMSGEGIEEVSDPSGLFLSSNGSVPVEGTCVTFTLDGHRSLPIEVQSLVTKSVLPTPRRAANGVDSNRIRHVGRRNVPAWRHQSVGERPVHLHHRRRSRQGAGLRSGHCGGVGECREIQGDCTHDLCHRRNLADRPGSSGSPSGIPVARGRTTGLHHRRSTDVAQARHHPRTHHRPSRYA